MLKLYKLISQDNPDGEKILESEMVFNETNLSLMLDLCVKGYSLERDSDGQIKVLKSWIGEETTDGTVISTGVAFFDAGYLDPIENIRLKCTSDARSLFTSQYILIESGMAKGLIEPGDMQGIWDYDKKRHEISSAKCIGLFLRYGAFYRDNYYRLMT